MSTKLNIMPFGGVRENGKNMYAVTVNDAIFILDAGLEYPESDLLGVDVVIPDFSYLVDNRDKIAGVFLTHGHADAIGALPYLLSEIQVPVFGSDLTIELAKLAVEAEPNAAGFDDYHVVRGNTEVVMNDVTVSFFETTHTIPESLGIVLETPAGQIVYTGNFKFDTTASPYYRTDLARLASIGSKKVLALLADAAGTANVGVNAHESEIADYILETFRANKQSRIIVAAVASNIQRIQQVIDAAYKVGRKIVLSGHDLEKIVRTALRLKKLTLPVPENEMFVSLKNLNKLAPEETVILETGRMGEPIQHLQRMAHGDDRNIQIGDGDLVFIATTPSTAMEGYVARTRDLLFRAGAKVVQISNDKKSSGHATHDDFQLLLNLLKPENVIPVQGEYRMMNAARNAALEVGYDDDHVFMLKNGDKLNALDDDTMSLAGSIQVNDTMIDGSGVGDIGSIVLNDRRILSEDGAFIAVVTIDRKKKKVVAKPKLDSRGFVYVKNSKDLMNEASDLVEKTVADGIKNAKEFDWSNLKNSVRDALGKFLYEQTRRKPVILPVIMEANQNGRRRKRGTGNKANNAKGNNSNKASADNTPNNDKKNHHDKKANDAKKHQGNGKPADKKPNRNGKKRNHSKNKPQNKPNSGDEAAK
ncbi:ribonuclease J [Weissella uvarum]|uniref:RNase J family beta-CASP ribonuclease n=1 Tax=Weissella uvarum TaxID=1479233 RepID=UPI0019606CB1|nr:RNase J family beta-CASP ribonuclease [Weissella uvarum]MBM7618122.1 ribonuclease J [Weissella uvarum]MCM0595136.1 RNase J family beta-CASP ribonuclease [Weissella uvarum]